MALMTFREKNLARWIGVRPGHRGTQISLEGDANNNTVELIDGTQTTITYITAFTISAYGNTSGQGRLFVTNNADVLQYNMAKVRATVNAANLNNGLGLFYPLEIPAGYKVKVLSTGVGVSIHAWIHGWEE